MSKTKLFLIGYFFPAWLSALLMWGDNRTSASFEAAPSWFYYFKFGMQILSIFILFFPLQLRSRPSLLGFFLSVATLYALSFVRPILEAEYVLVSSSIQICALVIFLCFAQPSAKLRETDIRFLFYMFLFGFLLQIGLYVGFGREPAHTITDVFVRFNGITNDSLATGVIIGMFVPWAIKAKFSEIKVLAIVGMAIASGSLFSVLFVPTAILLYLIYNRLYRFACIIIAGIAGVGAVFYDTFVEIIDIKFGSILSHMRFFLNMGGLQYEQSTKNCSEEFCESFIEAGIHLNPAYLVLFYTMFICFFVQFVLVVKPLGERRVTYDTLRVYGAAILVASLVHPVPLIPFAIPMFFILATVYRGESLQVSLPVQRPARI